MNKLQLLSCQAPIEIEHLDLRREILRCDLIDIGHKTFVLSLNFEFGAERKFKYVDIQL